jgi:hypothetical protein
VELFFSSLFAVLRSLRFLDDKITKPLPQPRQLTMADKLICFASTIGIGVLLMLILVLLSFSYVE